MKKPACVFFLALFVIPGFVLAGPKTPCTVIAYAYANTYVQAPSYSQDLTFDSSAPATFTRCYDEGGAAPTFWGPTTATIIVANPPQNPPPSAPVYMSLNTAAGAVSPQVLLSQGTTVITSDQFPNWFPGTDYTTVFSGVTIYSPSTPWVPSSITIIWQ